MTYCSSTPAIAVDWSTNGGDTTLQVAPDDSAPRSVAPRGTLSIPPHDATITLTVTRGELAPHRALPVRVAQRRPLIALVTDADGGTCADGWVTAGPADFGDGSAAFDPRARASLITNTCDRGAGSGATCHRAVRVEHAGRRWQIHPRGVLDLTRESMSLAGPWTLSQQLLPGETCGTPSAGAALEVDLSIELDCQ